MHNGQTGILHIVGNFQGKSKNWVAMWLYNAACQTLA